MNGQCLTDYVVVNYKQQDKDDLIHFVTHIDPVQTELKNVVSPTAKSVYTSKFNAWYMKTYLSADDDKVSGMDLEKSYKVEFQGKKFIFAFVDANFCTGSVVLVLHGPFGTYLYTGNYWYSPSILKSPIVQQIIERKVLNKLYLDTTYYEQSTDFLSSEDITKKIISLIKKSRAESSSTIYIYMASWGLELFLIKIAQEIKEPIFVDQNKFRMMEILDAAHLFTSQIKQARIVVLSCQFKKRGLEPSVVIRMEREPLPTQKFLSYSCDGKIHLFKFYCHSSHLECCKLLTTFKPEVMIPINPFFHKAKPLNHRKVSLPDILSNNSVGEISVVGLPPKETNFITSFEKCNTSLKVAKNLHLNSKLLIKNSAVSVEGSSDKINRVHALMPQDFKKINIDGAKTVGLQMGKLCSKEMGDKLMKNHDNTSKRFRNLKNERLRTYETKFANTVKGDMTQVNNTSQRGIITNLEHIEQLTSSNMSAHGNLPVKRNLPEQKTNCPLKIKNVDEINKSLGKSAPINTEERVIDLTKTDLVTQKNTSNVKFQARYSDNPNAYVCLPVEDFSYLNIHEIVQSLAKKSKGKIIITKIIQTNKNDQEKNDPEEDSGVKLKGEDHFSTSSTTHDASNETQNLNSMDDDTNFFCGKPSSSMLTKSSENVVISKPQFITIPGHSRKNSVLKISGNHSGISGLKPSPGIVIRKRNSINLKNSHELSNLKRVATNPLECTPKKESLIVKDCSVSQIQGVQKMDVNTGLKFKHLTFSGGDDKIRKISGNGSLTVQRTLKPFKISDVLNMSGKNHHLTIKSENSPNSAEGMPLKIKNVRSLSSRSRGGEVPLESEEKIVRNRLVEQRSRQNFVNKVDSSSAPLSNSCEEDGTEFGTDSAARVRLYLKRKRPEDPLMLSVKKRSPEIAGRDRDSSSRKIFASSRSNSLLKSPKQGSSGLVKCLGMNRQENYAKTNYFSFGGNKIGDSDGFLDVKTTHVTNSSDSSRKSKISNFAFKGSHSCGQEESHSSEKVGIISVAASEEDSESCGSFTGDLNETGEQNLSLSYIENLIGTTVREFVKRELAKPRRGRPKRDTSALRTPEPIVPQWENKRRLRRNINISLDKPVPIDIGNLKLKTCSVVIDDLKYCGYKFCKKLNCYLPGRRI